MNTARARSLRCVLFGADTLLSECATRLLDQGHSIVAVVSAAAPIRAWTESHGIPCVADDERLLDELRQYEFDYLFSITHLSVIREEVLGLARELCINFHDGPLPRYAGLNAPAWALINQERSYGISWHVITPGLDEGPILASEMFDLAPDETSLTLNMRCFEAGLNSFDRLLTGLVSGDLAGTSQDPSLRTYFGRDRRPEAACVLDWTRPAQELAAMIRALNFGHYQNPLGSPKMSFRDEIVVVTQASALDVDSVGTPGTVVACGPDAIEIATGEGHLTVFGIHRLCGQQASCAEIVAEWGLRAGDVLDVLSPGARERLTKICEVLARHEQFWSKRLAAIHSLELPYTNPAESGSDGSRQTLAVDIPAGFSSRYADSASVLSAQIAAVGVCLGKLAGEDRFDVMLQDWEAIMSRGSEARWFADAVPLSVESRGDRSFDDAVEWGNQALATIGRRQTHLRDLPGRLHHMRRPTAEANGRLPDLGVIISGGINGAEVSKDLGSLANCHLVLVLSRSCRSFDLSYAPSALSRKDVEQIAQHLQVIMAKVAAEPTRPVLEHDLLAEDERQRLLSDWNDTAADVDEAIGVHELIERQAARTPDATALACGNEELSYEELDRRANQIAHYLRGVGVKPGGLVGLCVERSTQLVACVLGILKTGAAYVPLDPSFPDKRIQYMATHAGLSAVVAQQHLVNKAQVDDVAMVVLEEAHSAIASEPEASPAVPITGSDLAYVIYTSGSTGKPKGVMVEHRNVANFFVAMDGRIDVQGRSVWLAVTSLSFDISVLELLWTLTRGFKVVIYRGLTAAGGEQTRTAPQEQDGVRLSLAFFAADASELSDGKYDLVLGASRLADQRGFHAVWTPERHFHAFGGLYPNPSVISAAIAAITENLQIRAGSVVLPLHSPIRVAEEWSVVDNLSRGRVGISVATGWHPNDFVLAPSKYEDRKEEMLLDLQRLQSLWRGEAVEFVNPKGETVATRILPRPVQPDLPTWMTAAGNPETFRSAGAAGLNLLTHLLGQSPAELAEKIAVYRTAWEEAGHPGSGHVTVMLHTFVGDRVDTVKEIVRGPMQNYLRTAVDLIKNHVSSWAAVKTAVNGDGETVESLEDVSPEDLQALLDFAFDRYFETSALFGTPESCMGMVDQLVDMGVDEIACLVDFGVSSKTVLTHLDYLADLKDRISKPVVEEVRAESIADLIEKHDVTHLQCTPSMAAMLVEDQESQKALSMVRVMMVGGEALPGVVAQKLTRAIGGEVLNMYGPTETTVWSSTSVVASGDKDVTIGRPVANTSFYVLDRQLQPVPVGVAGELWIGGKGVTRGYLHQPELTNERFIPDPFDKAPDRRIYRTGDLVRYLPSGDVEFLGRMDHQVKVRGYRIELGEIENRLMEHAAVQAAAVVTRQDSVHDTRLVAGVIGVRGETTEAAELKAHLQETLPDYMVPTEFTFVDEFPMTPNGKLDRRALSEIGRHAGAATRVSGDVVKAPPRSGDEVAVPGSDEREAAIADIWCRVLQTDRVGRDDNFFDLGGHSLLTIKVQSVIQRELGVSVTLVDLFRFTTLRTLAAHVAGLEGPESADVSHSSASKGVDRAARRRRVLRRKN